MASCGQMVEGQTVAFACDLDAGHEGPHRAYENARSVRERTRWEAAQKTEQARSDLSQFQGPAQTTAERYTEGATAVPGTPPRRVTEMAGDRPEIEAAERPVVYEEGEDGSATFAEVGGQRYIDCPNCLGVMQIHTEDGSALCGSCGLALEAGSWDHPGIGEPTKQREGDQPLPTQNDGDYVQDRIIAKINAVRGMGALTNEQADLLISQMEDSKTVGMQRYGSALQTFNGRDALQDAAEEARDLYVYLNSLIQAREAQRETLVEVVTKAFRSAEPDEEDSALAAIAVDAILKATGGLGT